MGKPKPGSKSKFVMATVIGMDTETGQWQHQLAVYTLKLLVKFGIKYLPGQIYMVVLRTNTDRSHQVVPYDSGAIWSWYTISNSVCSQDHWLYHFTY